MKYTDGQLNGAVKNNIFTEEQIQRFREYVQNSGSRITTFHKVLYYGGGLLIVSAMTWLMGICWDRSGPAGMAVVSALYCAAFLAAGCFVFFRKKLELAGGVLLSIPAVIMPLFMYSLLRALNSWPPEWPYGGHPAWEEGKWLILHASAAAVALPVFLKTKFPLLVFLMAGTLWFSLLAIVPVLRGEKSLTWTERAVISELYGLCMIAVGYAADMKFKRDYAFWFYVPGLLALLFGLSAFHNDSVFRFALLCAASVLFIAFSLFTGRDVFMVAGAAGITEFLSRLAWEFFEGSVLFPSALTLIGVLLIVSGIFFQKRRKDAGQHIADKLPPFLAALRPGRHI